jgi:hypothetical protein
MDFLLIPFGMPFLNMPPLAGYKVCEFVNSDKPIGFLLRTLTVT